MYFTIKPVPQLTPAEIAACEVATSPIPFDGFALPPSFYIQLAWIDDQTVVGYNVYTIKNQTTPFRQEILPVFFYLRSFVHRDYRDKDIFRKMFIDSVKHHIGEDAFDQPFVITALTINPKILRFMDTFFMTYPSPKHHTPEDISNFVAQQLYRNMELVAPDNLLINVKNAAVEYLEKAEWEAVYQTQTRYMGLVMPTIFKQKDEKTIEVQPNRIFGIGFWQGDLDKKKLLVK